MTWFRVDDKLSEHPKVRRIPRSQRRNAMGLWVLAGSWCAANVETTDARDGNVPLHMLDELCSKPSDAAALARVGLWHAAGHDCTACPQPVDPDGWIFHQWGSLQYTAEQRQKKKAAEAERQRRHREKARATGNDDVTRDTSVTNSVSNGAVHTPRPDPTRPDPNLTTPGGQRTETFDVEIETLRPEDARCAEHQGVENPPPCRGCMKAREAVEKKIAARAEARREARANCKRCFGSGWVETVDGELAEKCDHRPILEVVR